MLLSRLLEMPAVARRGKAEREWISASRAKWLLQAINVGGNYGEIFERNVGKASPLKLERGLNGLWTKGGLMYAIPFK